MDHGALDHVEAEAWGDLLLAQPASNDAPEVDTTRTRTVLRAPSTRCLLFNRILGLGVGAAASEAALRADLQGFAARGIHHYFVHLSPHARPPQLRDWLVRAGLERYPRGWAKMARGRQAPPASETALRIEPASPAHATALARLLIAGFDLDEGSEPLLKAMVGRAGWHPLLAFDGETPVAAGALFVKDGIGYLAGAATLPAHRGRGAQSALMARRIAMALDLGCHTLCSETGEAVPGDPQHSYRNMRKAGFREAYVRENHAPAGTRWRAA